jgi:hypothetical protein
VNLCGLSRSGHASLDQPGKTFQGSRFRDE